MTTDEIHELIQNCDHCGQGGTMHILPILERMNNKTAELESKLLIIQNRVVDLEAELLAVDRRTVGIKP